MNALQKLESANHNKKFICIGLDTDINKLPESLLKESNPILEFNRRIIEATSKYAAAYKINFAFYEVEGANGLKNIEQTLNYIPHDILTIGDAKRGDIGNTSKMYASAVFDSFGFDSITLHPYMGYDSVSPFLEYDNKLNFILALTSNPGANDFERLKLRDGSYVFQNVINAVKNWNKKNNCGIVFGATKIEDLKENFEHIADLPILLPGVGAQGGKLDDVVNAFKEINRKRYLINISRGIIYKGSSDDFDLAAAEEIISLNNQVSNLLS
ncbi:MAG TPA: orotidine-5'-phosphate decarboxylase [Ignavibacteriaceae bacterium]|nr:orotidine-5'-phosphate decarboxylase [Ignavibacteriaceae bacterium]